MTRRRRHLALPALAVAALFAAQVAAPRAAFVLHAHAGGGHTHAHRDAALLAELGLEDLAHAKPHRHTHDDDGRPALRATGAHDAAHYHQRQYMQSAALAPLIVIWQALPLGRVAALCPALAPAAFAARASARAPPRPLFG